MNKAILFLILLLTTTNHLVSQGSTAYWTPPKLQTDSPFRIEMVKGVEDCTIFSYALQEYNRTVTPRDDRDLGVNYFVSGNGCQLCFEDAFSRVKFKDEEFMPIPSKRISFNSKSRLGFHSTNEVIAEGHTKLFRSAFWNDSGTPDESRDDVYMGSDYVIYSADPDLISSAFDLSYIKEEFPDIASLKAIFTKDSYYKLRELIVNRNNIVELLRKENKLIDITTNEPKVQMVKLIKN